MRALGPAPLPNPLTEAHVEEHRDLRCRRYDACLARAARGDWASWTCTHCLRFHRRRALVTVALGSFRDATPPGRMSPRAKEAGRSAAALGGAAQRVRGVGGAGGAAAPAPTLAGAAGESPPRAKERRDGTGHTLEARRGGVLISLEAPSVPALFVEAGRAVADVVRGPSCETVGACDEEVAIAAPDREALLGEWVRQLVLRSERSTARFTEHDIVYLTDRRLVASVRGARLAQVPDVFETATCHDPSIHQRADGVRATVVLDV